MLTHNANSLNIRIGTAGWSYKDWDGVVYPHPKPRGFDPLAFLARKFDVVEINSTFYRPPAEKISRGWAERVRDFPNFRFTLKLHQQFTHERERISSDAVSLFKKGVEPVAESGCLGCVLAQFPASFHFRPSNLDYLERLFGWFGEYPLAVEVRGREWNNNGFFGFLSEHKVGFCNIDQPHIDNQIKPTEIVTSPIGYVRLHGRNRENWFNEQAGRDQRYDYLYSGKELGPWIQRIREIAARAIDTYVISNNHYRGQALVNSFQMQHELTGEKVDPPESLIKKYPVLGPIAKQPIKQTELF